MSDQPVAVCVFAKPPVPGQVKTRVARDLGDVRAASLAAALLLDTWSCVTPLPWARPILATSDPSSRHFGLPDAERWDHGGGDLGARIERILARGVSECHGAMALGADCPGIPRSALEAARRALADGLPALGAAEDGGFYGLAVPRCPPGLLAQLPWSVPETHAATRARLLEHFGEVVDLPPWFDVDDVDDIARLKTQLAAGVLVAPRLAAWFAA